MQKLMLITDNTSMETVNDLLEQEEFELSNVISDGNGRWIAVLDDSLDIFGEGEFDFDEDEDDD